VRNYGFFLISTVIFPKVPSSERIPLERSRIEVIARGFSGKPDLAPPRNSVALTTASRTIGASGMGREFDLTARTINDIRDSALHA
jgi:hypothetical protein